MLIFMSQPQETNHSFLPPKTSHASETNAKISIEDTYEVLLLEFEDTQVILAKIFIIYMLYASYYCQTCRPRVPVRSRRDSAIRGLAVIQCASVYFSVSSTGSRRYI